MYRTTNIMLRVVAALCFAGLSATEALGETRIAGGACNLNPDSIKPYTITMVNEPVIMKSPMTDEHGPIVDRKYYMNCKFTPSGTEEMYLLHHLTGTAEFADGYKIEQVKEQSGMISVGSLLAWNSFVDDIANTKKYNKISETYSVKLATEDDPHTDVSLTGKWEIKEDIFDVWDYRDGKNLYEALRNISSQNLVAHTYTRPTFVDQYNVRTTVNDLSAITEGFKKQLLDEGQDPENFPAMFCGWQPTVAFIIEGIKYNDIRKYLFGNKLEYGLFGKMYVEGGFGKNCTLMVTSEPPAAPTGSATITRLENPGKYMDAWTVVTTLESSQYGVKYTMLRNDTYYLPYPTDDERKEMARAAGYDVP